MQLALLQRCDCASTVGLRPTRNEMQSRHRAFNGSLPCRLEMITAEASTQLCTCVFDCNVPLLRRYIKAGILVNAGNFDSRTALHLAAAEGNLAAVRLRCTVTVPQSPLQCHVTHAEHYASTLLDRWFATVAHSP